MTGFEMMLQSLIKILGLKKEVIEQHIMGIGDNIKRLADNSEIVRRQNSAIMSHLGIAEPILTPSNGLDHDGQSEQRNGPQRAG